MAKVGLIAGGGDLPLEFVRAARKAGDSVVVFALEEMASSSLEKEADKVYWVRIGQYGKFALLLVKERIRRLAMVGKVDKSVIYRDEDHDEEFREGLKQTGNRKDYTILETVTRHLKKVGVEVIPGVEYLSHLLPERGVLSSARPDNRVEEDMIFGYDIAKEIAGMDIGQTVIVKDKTVVAVEAMEGTDTVIERAGAIAGEGCVMVKVSRPDQDPRWDVPTVGPATITKLSENRFSALAIESGKMFLVDREKFLKTAEENGIVVRAL